MIILNKKYPLAKKLSIDGFIVGKDREMITACLKSPIREVRSNLKSNNLSLTAYLVSCFGKALSEHPDIHAIHSLTGRLISFDEVDIGVLIEVEYENELMAIIHVVRNAHLKSVKEITDEIRYIKANPLESDVLKKARFFKVVLRLPAFIRRLYLRFLARSPKLMKKEAGVAVVTAVGMMGSGSYVFGPPTVYNVSMIVGGIYDEQLHMTVSVNHRTVDGAPFTRFLNTFEALLRKNNVNTRNESQAKTSSVPSYYTLSGLG